MLHLPSQEDQGTVSAIVDPRISCDIVVQWPKAMYAGDSTENNAHRPYSLLFYMTSFISASISIYSVKVRQHELWSGLY